MKCQILFSGKKYESPESGKCSCPGLFKEYKQTYSKNLQIHTNILLSCLFYNICCVYSLEALAKALLMSSHNVCLCSNVNAFILIISRQNAREPSLQHCH